MEECAGGEPDFSLALLTFGGSFCVINFCFRKPAVGTEQFSYIIEFKIVFAEFSYAVCPSRKASLEFFQDCLNTRFSDVLRVVSFEPGIASEIKIEIVG